jgi:predicted P-loop ATPase
MTISNIDSNNASYISNSSTKSHTGQRLGDIVQPLVFSDNARQELIQSLESIPKEWVLTPVKDKVSTRKNWQNEEPLSQDFLKLELKSKRWNGYGLRLGDVSGGKVALDVDGPSAVVILKALESTHEPLLKTVSWASGKDGRSQLLFQIPEHYRDRFKSFKRKSINEYSVNGQILKCQTDENGKPIEELDFRYNGHQSVLPPSFHPETGSYHWIISPNDGEVAIAPDWLCEFILELSEPKKVQKNTPLKFEYSTFEKGDKNIHNEWIASIPIGVLGYYEWRDFLLALHYEGYSENEALSISQSSSKHTDKGFYDVWKHIKNDKSNNITGGSLWYLATTYGNWKPKESDKKQWVKKKQEFEIKALTEAINKGSLGERLSALIDRTEDDETLFKVAVELAKDFPDPVENLKEWIEKDFGSLADSKINRHTKFVGAVMSHYGDDMTELKIAQLIKKTTGITRIDPIKKALKDVKKKVSPTKTPKQKKIDFISKRFNNLSFNQLTGNVERDGKEYKSIELAYISPELSDCEDEIGKDFAVDTIVKLAKDNSFHPVKNYLDSLDVNNRLSESQWNAIASVLLGVPLTDELSNIVLKKFLISAVARIYDPGCYVRLILVLQGVQNCGKSTFARLLAGADFFNDSLGNLDNLKDDLDILHRSWILEWSELDRLNKKTSGEVKSFITKPSDTYRKPYAKAPETHLRQSVIIGTCNRTDFLKDATGNTRYSVIPVGEIDLEAVKLYRDRIWATAKYEYLSGTKWELDEAEQRLSEINNESFTEVDPWMPEIQNYIQGRNKVSVNEILTQCLHIEKAHYTRAFSKQVRDCLQVLGWGEKSAAMSSFEGKKVRHFYPSIAGHNRDTEKNSTVSDCVSNVSPENLTVITFEDLDTQDTVKKEKETVSEISLTYPIETNQINNEEIWRTTLIEKNCVYCVSAIQTLTQQEIQETHLETQFCPKWVDLIQKNDAQMAQLGWTEDDGKNYLSKKYGKTSRQKLSDEQVLEFIDHLESLCQAKRSNTIHAIA